MYVKVRTVDGKTNVTVTISKITSVQEFKALVERKMGIKIGKQRLFYRGKQLEDEYKMFDYDIRLNDVVQLMVKPDPEILSLPSTTTAKTPDHVADKCSGDRILNKTEKLSCSSKYYKVGDLVDVRKISNGAWFEGRIVGIVERDEKCSETAKLLEVPEGACNGNVEDVNVEGMIPKVKVIKGSGNRNMVENPEDDGILYQIVFEENEDDTAVEVNFEHVRPRARYKYDLNDLKINDVVMANYNIDNPHCRGYWYDVRITAINKRRRDIEIICCLYTGRDAAILENCKIIFCDDILKIEKPISIVDRSSEYDKLMQTGTTPLRQIALNCPRCHDNPNVRCRECSCYVCGGKDDPALQILCDECNTAYHIRCLEPPLEAIPDSDEWYCPDCKNDENEIVKAGEKLKESKKKAKLQSKNPKSTRDWGKGMACVGRTRECTLVQPNHYGPIPGVEVGTSWLYRVQVSESGVHRPHVAGIHGRESDGAYSIVLSGGYEDDVDNGDEFLYTGSGGRDLSGNKRTADQSSDQTLTRLNKALALNCNAKLNNKGAKAKNWKDGKPVRVVRNYKLKKYSKYAPDVGNRYDGIYKVVEYYPEKGKSGFIVWRYRLRRDDDSPAPWTPEGKRFIKLHGLEKAEVPDGYLESIGEKLEPEEQEPKEQKTKSQKRLSEAAKDHNSPIKRHKSVEFKLDRNLKMLIEQDVNTKLWDSCSQYLRDGKQKYIAKVAETFMCICCQELVHKPVTTICRHNFCKNCLQRSFAASVYTCPCCRCDLGRKCDITVNESLSAILHKLFPGYEDGRQ